MTTFYDENDRCRRREPIKVKIELENEIPSGLYSKLNEKAWSSLLRGLFFVDIAAISIFLVKKKP